MWRVFRTAEPIGIENRTYAYPNPFAPDDEPIRIHFSLQDVASGNRSVTIRIFDFAMHPVQTIIQNASRSNGSEYDELWDGRNAQRTLVANGVYFYRVEITNKQPAWGKILVLK